MRYFVLLICAVFASSAATYMATRAAIAEAPVTAAVADEEAGVLRIFVSGKEVARFAVDGLHVRDDIKFGGFITDVGPGGFNAPGDAGAQ